MRVYSKSRGFTLIETVMFIIIVGIAVAAIGQQFVTNVSHSHEPLLRQQALAVANAYMDEILRKRWNENTPTGGGCVDTLSGTCPGGPALSVPNIGTDLGEDNANSCANGANDRSNYDDVDDYSTINSEPPTESSGCNPMPGYGNFTVTVNVVIPNGWNASVNDLDARQITVRVNTPDNQSITLDAYRINY